MAYDIEEFSPKNGRLIKEDGSTANLADLLTDDGVKVVLAGDGTTGGVQDVNATIDGVDTSGGAVPVSGTVVVDDSTPVDVAVTNKTDAISIVDTAITSLDAADQGSIDLGETVPDTVNVLATMLTNSSYRVGIALAATAASDLTAATAQYILGDGFDKLILTGGNRYLKWCVLDGATLANGGAADYLRTAAQ
jgi:hypothetical protein